MKHIGTQRIETKRLLLRKIKLSDAEMMFNNWASDEEVTRYLTWMPHESIENSKGLIGIWLEELQCDSCYKWCIELKETNQVIGTIDVVDMIKNIDSAVMGYCLSSKYWNQGIMTEALSAVQQFLFEEVGFNRIEAYYHTANPSSGKVMEKSGMKYEGVRRQYAKDNQGNFVDVVTYAILRDDFKKSSKSFS